MSLAILAATVVSPLGVTASEHAFFWEAEVAPNASGAFTDADGDTLPVFDCGWIPAIRPHASRARLLARRALSAVRVADARPPIVLVGPEEDDARDELVRFLELSGERVARTFPGAAAFAPALAYAADLLGRDGSEANVIVLAAESRLSEAHLDAWLAARDSGFTRTPFPPSEGAAAIRVARDPRGAIGRVLGWSAGKSSASDENDAPPDHELARLFGEVPLAPSIPLVVGPRDVDDLRMRDFQYASVRHYGRIEAATLPSLEGRVGGLGAATGLASLVFAHAWLRHGVGRADGVDGAQALVWARSSDGALGVATVEASSAHAPGVRTLSNALREVPAATPIEPRAPLPPEPIGALDAWEGRVRRDAERGAGATLATLQERVRRGLFERALVVGRDHVSGPHLGRPEAARRFLRHVDALGEAGASAGWIAEAAIEAECEAPGDVWALTLLLATLGGPDAGAALRTWSSATERGASSDFDGVEAVGAALAVQPSEALALEVRTWLRDADPFLAAAAIEATPSAALGGELAMHLARRTEPLVVVAVERLVARASDTERRMALAPMTASLDAGERRWLSGDLGPRLATEAARARILRGATDAAALVRMRDARALAALGEGALEILALVGEAEDGEIARAIAAALPSTDASIDALGRCGFVEILPRLLAELGSEDFAEAAHAALTTALGARADDATRTAWETALGDLALPAEAQGRGRLRGGVAYGAGAVAAEMRRPELSEREVRRRADELAALSGRGQTIAWATFGQTLERAIGVAASTDRRATGRDMR